MSSYALKPWSSSDESLDESGEWFVLSPSARGLFLLFESLTTHSTSSRRQLVQGVPLSMTSHLTFLDRQQWQALEARRFTVRPLDGSPAEVALRFRLGLIAAGEAIVVMLCQGEISRLDYHSNLHSKNFSYGVADLHEMWT